MMHDVANRLFFVCVCVCLFPKTTCEATNLTNPIPRYYWIWFSFPKVGYVSVPCRVTPSPALPRRLRKPHWLKVWSWHRASHGAFSRASWVSNIHFTSAEEEPPWNERSTHLKIGHPTCSNQPFLGAMLLSGKVITQLGKWFFLFPWIWANYPNLTTE